MSQGLGQEASQIWQELQMEMPKKDRQMQKGLQKRPVRQILQERFQMLQEKDQEMQTWLEEHQKQMRQERPLQKRPEEETRQRQILEVLLITLAIGIAPSGLTLVESVFLRLHLNKRGAWS